MAASFLKATMILMWTLVRARGFLIKGRGSVRRGFRSSSWLNPRHPTLLSTSMSISRVWLSLTSSDASFNSPSFLNDTDSYDSWEQEESEHDDDEACDDNGRVLLKQECELWTNAVTKAAEALKKKKASLQSEWEKAQNIEQTVTRAHILVSNLYMFTNPLVREATVHDWENDGAQILLKLDPQYDSASAEADALFERARKLKRGSNVIRELLEETDRALETLTDAQLDLSSACNSDGSVVEEDRYRLVQDRLQRTAKLTKFQLPSNPSSSSQRREQQQRSSSSPYDNIRKLTSPGGCPVLVGRNRRGNEYLSFQVARGKDIWMHARGCPGAHVLIQWRRGGPEPTDACWQFAADLATFYSDARMERKAEVTAAEAKHLLKPRGAPLGAVKLRQELQVLVGRPEHVDESLKLARDKSGQSDEYRSMDKAKHRRHTQQVAKQTQAKKRAEHQAKRKRRNKIAGNMEEVS